MLHQVAALYVPGGMLIPELFKQDAPVPAPAPPVLRSRAVPELAEQLGCAPGDLSRFATLDAGRLPLRPVHHNVSLRCTTLSQRLRIAVSPAILDGESMRRLDAALLKKIWMVSVKPLLIVGHTETPLSQPESGPREQPQALLSEAFGVPVLSVHPPPAWKAVEPVPAFRALAVAAWLGLDEAQLVVNPSGIAFASVAAAHDATDPMRWLETVRSTDVGRSLRALRDPRTHPVGAKVFGRLRPAEIVAGMRAVVTLSDEAIHAAVRRCTQLPASVQDQLAKALSIRRTQLDRRYPEARTATEDFPWTAWPGMQDGAFADSTPRGRTAAPLEPMVDLDWTDPTLQAIAAGSFKGRAALAWLRERYPGLLYRGASGRAERLEPRQAAWRQGSFRELFPEAASFQELFHPEGFADGDPAICAATDYEVPIFMGLVNGPCSYIALPDGTDELRALPSTIERVHRERPTACVQIFDPAGFLPFTDGIPKGNPIITAYPRSVEMRAYHTVEPVLTIEIGMEDWPENVVAGDTQDRPHARPLPPAWSSAPADLFALPFGRWNSSFGDLRFLALGEDNLVYQAHPSRTDAGSSWVRKFSHRIMTMLCRANAAQGLPIDTCDADTWRRLTRVADSYCLNDRALAQHFGESHVAQHGAVEATRLLVRSEMLSLLPGMVDAPRIPDALHDLPTIVRMGRYVEEVNRPHAMEFRVELTEALRRRLPYRDPRAYRADHLQGIRAWVLGRDRQPFDQRLFNLQVGGSIARLQMLSRTDEALRRELRRLLAATLSYSSTLDYFGRRNVILHPSTFRGSGWSHVLLDAAPAPGSPDLLLAASHVLLKLQQARREGRVDSLSLLRNERAALLAGLAYIRALNGLAHGLEMPDRLYLPLADEFADDDPVWGDLLDVLERGTPAIPERDARRRNVVVGASIGASGDWLPSVLGLSALIHSGA